ncbi:MAG: HAMP domain-containing protein [Deltaproteobacteria bacterium]|nr:MAG: HAMP domain-containing protein [Deltaproteobacteria bacterium]
MRLKTRLVLSFLLVAWIPLGTVVGVLTQQTDAAFERSFEVRKDAAIKAVQSRLDRVSQNVKESLDKMLVAERDVLEHDLIAPLQRKVFYPPYDADEENYEAAIVKMAERLITSTAVDTLRLVDLKERVGHVIALGHRIGLESQLDTAIVTLAAKHPDETVFKFERGREVAGAVPFEWTLLRLRVIDGRVALVGGKILDTALLEYLLGGSDQDTHVALQDARGNRVAATFVDAEPHGDFVRGTHPLRNPGESDPVFTLTVYVSRAEVEERLRDLWAMAGILASASGLLALLAGLWISRRLSRPLEALAAAASEVAAGDRDTQVPELRGDDEVAVLTRTFNQMTLELSESEERLKQSERVAAWREIARRIAHEIKNPLFPIQMSIETLVKVWERKHPDFEEIFHESTATILEEVARMKRIVTEFSDFARMPAPRPVDTELLDLATQVVGLHRDTAPEVDLRVVGEAEVVVQVDPDQLRQALINLVKNGLEALRGGGGEVPEGASLEVRVTPGSDDTALIVITDNGPGMDEATQQKLFVPYFTTKAEGTGLGLAIVHRIIAEHGGTIRVDSQEGVGTRFAIRLPRRAPHALSAPSDAG